MHRYRHRILGIAYPIIMDKISNIGHKFSSNYLANAFENEFSQTKFLGIFPGRSRRITIFEWILFFTIGSFIFLILDLEPLFWKDKWMMQNSAKLLTLFLILISRLFRIKLPPTFWEFGEVADFCW